MSNSNFATFWKVHRDAILVMMQPVNLTGITAEQYRESQAKKAAELIYMAGLQDGATESLRESTELLAILNKEMSGQPLSAEERIAARLFSDDDVPDFLSGQSDK